jgi:multimeric flavodoxin WrbA
MLLDPAGDLRQQGKLVDKVAKAFTSSQTEHGGQESTILALNNTLYHWGALVLPLGTRCTRSSTAAEIRTAHPLPATTVSPGRTRRR